MLTQPVHLISLMVFIWVHVVHLYVWLLLCVVLVYYPIAIGGIIAVSTSMFSSMGNMNNMSVFDQSKLIMDLGTSTLDIANILTPNRFTFFKGKLNKILNSRILNKINKASLIYAAVIVFSQEPTNNVVEDRYWQFRAVTNIIGLISKTFQRFTAPLIFIDLALILRNQLLAGSATLNEYWRNLDLTDTSDRWILLWRGIGGRTTFDFDRYIVVKNGIESYIAGANNILKAHKDVSTVVLPTDVSISFVRKQVSDGSILRGIASIQCKYKTVVEQYKFSVSSSRRTRHNHLYSDKMLLLLLPDYFTDARNYKKLNFSHPLPSSIKFVGNRLGFTKCKDYLRIACDKENGKTLV